MLPVLVVHGGAGLIASERERGAHAAILTEAIARGLEALASSASDAVVAAVAAMESAASLNAGRGATLDAEGRVSLDAGFMEGRERRFGAVGCVTRTMNPIVLAHALSREGEFGRFIVGPYADALVERMGAAPCRPEELITAQALSAWKKRAAHSRAADTVGAVAHDAQGRVAAAVSTGGLSHKPPGRVGDSAVVGAGFWAELPLGACVTTGIGEAMLREGTARRCVRLLAEGATPGQAAERALGEVSGPETRPPCGLILVTGDGRVAIAHTSPEMIAGHAREGERPTVRARW